MPHQRLHALNGKVHTKFGTLHPGIMFDDQGHVRVITIKHPAKHMDTAVGDALVAISAELTVLIETVMQRVDANAAE